MKEKDLEKVCEEINRHMADDLAKAAEMKYFGNYLDKVKIKLQDVPYNIDYLQRHYKKITGQTIRKKCMRDLYDEILKEIYNGKLEAPKSYRDKNVGIKGLKFKMEKYYGCNFDEINEKKDEIKETMNILEQVEFVGDYEANADGSISYKLKEFEFVKYMLERYTPFFLNGIFKHFICNRLECDEARIIFILATLKLMNDDYDDDGMIRIDEDEFDGGYMLLKSYNISEPDEYGVYILFRHIYTDTEKNILRRALKQNFKGIMSLLEIEYPPEMNASSFEYNNYIITTLALEKIAKRNNVSEDDVIESIISLIEKGFMRYKNTAS